MVLRRSQKEILADNYSKHYKIVDAKEDLFNVISTHGKKQYQCKEDLFNVISTYGKKQYHIYMVIVEYAGRIYNIKSFVGEIILELLIDGEIKIDYNQDLFTKELNENVLIQVLKRRRNKKVKLFLKFRAYISL